MSKLASGSNPFTQNIVFVGGMDCTSRLLLPYCNWVVQSKGLLDQPEISAIPEVKRHPACTSLGHRLPNSEGDAVVDRRRRATLPKALRDPKQHTSVLGHDRYDVCVWNKPKLTLIF